MSERPFCVKGGEIIGNVPTIEELAFYIKDYILNDAYSSEWGTDIVKGATRQAVYNIIQSVVGQLEYKGLWDASSEEYPSNPELGWYYVVSVGGTIDRIMFEIGDWIIWNGTSWDKLTGKSDVMPIGTVLMYNGTGIINPATRETQIGDEVGDLIKMAGWYVCNGQAGTIDLADKFIKAKSTSGQGGGSHDAVLVEHTHNLYRGSGVDGLGYIPYGGAGSPINWMAGDISTEGVSGVGMNVPGFVTMIFIVKMG